MANRLMLTTEEEWLLVGDHKERVHMEKDGSLVADGDRIFIHPSDTPPMVWHLDKANPGQPCFFERLSPLPFPTPVLLVGQSSSRVCFREPWSSRFFVWNVNTETVEADISHALQPRPGFLPEAAYGFAHTARGSFKILRLPCLAGDGNAGNSYFDMYHSDTGIWVQAEAKTMPFDPYPEPALFSRKHGSLFWKVIFHDRTSLISYDVNHDTLYQILETTHIHDHDLNKLTFGPGCDDTIIASTPLSDDEIRLFTLDFHVDKIWRLTPYSIFKVSLPRCMLHPLVGISKDADQYLYFLCNKSAIVGFKFCYDGILWVPKSKYTLDLSPNAPADAISLGPRVFAMEPALELVEHG